jgi:CubicO group peptidase (beta-lactamase class C family)
MPTIMSKLWATKSLEMFTDADQTQNFRSLASIFPCRVVRRATQPHRFTRGRALPLPETYEYAGQSHSSAVLLGSTESAGMLVLHRGALRYEKYWLDTDADTQWGLWSITKSWVSALMGVAVAEGAIESIDDQITQYVPRLAGTAYEGATIKHVLQMSSGAHWDEAYWDADSDIRKAGRGLAEGGSRGDVALGLQREFEPGTYHRYSSIDTHVLGMVLRRATQRTLVDYLREKLWAPLGAECDAFWVVEADGREWAAAGLSSTLRDAAKLGQLFAQQGMWEGRQLLSSAWIQASCSADAPHLRPGPRESSASPLGYGYQWWLPDATGPFCAMGVYNQFVYVDPAREVVIAKFSANRSYASNTDPESFREPEHFAFFRAVVERCAE